MKEVHPCSTRLDSIVQIALQIRLYLRLSDSWYQNHIPKTCLPCLHEAVEGQGLRQVALSKVLFMTGALGPRSFNPCHIHRYSLSHKGAQVSDCPSLKGWRGSLFLWYLCFNSCRGELEYSASLRLVSISSSPMFLKKAGIFTTNELHPPIRLWRLRHVLNNILSLH